MSETPEETLHKFIESTAFGAVRIGDARLALASLRHRQEETQVRTEKAEALAEAAQLLEAQRRTQLQQAEQERDEYQGWYNDLAERLQQAEQENARLSRERDQAVADEKAGFQDALNVGLARAERAESQLQQAETALREGFDEDGWPSRLAIGGSDASQAFHARIAALAAHQAEDIP